MSIIQPAASRILAEIETIVGSPPFEKLPKGISPTLLGEALVKRTDRLLFEFYDLSREVEELITGHVVLRKLAQYPVLPSAA